MACLDCVNMHLSKVRHATVQQSFVYQIQTIRARQCVAMSCQHGLQHRNGYKADAAAKAVCICAQFGVHIRYQDFKYSVHNILEAFLLESQLMKLSRP
jgi:tRNA(Ile)-lysidine synthase TilS/MesJ